MIRLLRLAFASLAFAAALAMPGIASSRDWDWHGPGGSHRIEHVFVITLENEGYDVTFGAASKAPYLSQTLKAKGALLTQYFGTGHFSLDNYIAMISGQAATNETRADCQTYADFQLSGMTADGQAIGIGCVYPRTIKTLPDQMRAAGKTWRAYMEDMGADPSREASTCGHPVLNAADNTQNAEAPNAKAPRGDQYASRHNPFVYFHSIIDSADCEANVVNLDRLSHDIAFEATTPNFVFITPNLCNDGHDAPCVNGQPGGLVSADQFLQKWVPIIMSSPAYQRGGLLVINFDEGGIGSVAKNASGGYVISTPGESCCSEQPGPNLGSFPQTIKIGSYSLTNQGFGGDRSGALLLSPFIKPGSVSNTPFNHYSLLKTVEDIFGLDYLGYAAQPGLVGFFGCVSSDITVNTEDQFSTCRQRR
ncbi:alkaline phosphatase family protein [Methylocella tundrae]|uniref:alkaline phosphatase family protein n=1 Tax=Methylocella tundrae TaxID=227605 RepID=UPI0030FE2678|nr:alkaline phosphatase family protein [Methylocella tundrae]